MAGRRKVLDIGRTAPATAVIRRRRIPHALPSTDRDGRIVHVAGGEDFTIRMLRAIPGEVNRHRNSGNIHISTLLSGCLRKIAITEQYNVAYPPNVVSDTLGITFAQGTAIHNFVKKQFARGHPDKLFGRWSCLCGDTITEPMVENDIPSRVCASCRLKPSVYQEVELIDTEHGIVGSPDIVLYIADRRFYYPIEIKSLSHELWKEIVRPRPDHVLQVVFYWRLLRTLGYSVPDQISLLYVTKGFNFKSPYKEFIIRPAAELPRLQEYLDEAASLKRFREGGPIPLRKMCSSITCSSAKQCHVAVTCFHLPG
jgi:hypothetical protein